MDNMTQHTMIENIITTLNSQIGTIRSLASEMDSEAVEYAAWEIETALFLLHSAADAIKEELKKEGYFCS